MSSKVVLNSGSTAVRAMRRQMMAGSMHWSGVNRPSFSSSAMSALFKSPERALDKKRKCFMDARLKIGPISAPCVLGDDRELLGLGKPGDGCSLAGIRYGPICLEPA